jgi:hypothetical protein
MSASQALEYTELDLNSSSWRDRNANFPDLIITRCFHVLNNHHAPYKDVQILCLNQKIKKGIQIKKKIQASRA